MKEAREQQWEGFFLFNARISLSHRLYQTWIAFYEDGWPTRILQFSVYIRYMKFTIMMLWRWWAWPLSQTEHVQGRTGHRPWLHCFAINRLESMYIMSLLWLLVVPYADNITRYLHHVLVVPHADNITRYLHHVLVVPHADNITREFPLFQILYNGEWKIPYNGEWKIPYSGWGLTLIIRLISVLNWTCTELALTGTELGNCIYTNCILL